MGCEVVAAISRGESKRAFAVGCGATEFIASSDKAAMKAAAGKFDLIIDCIPIEHDYMPYRALTKSSGER